jgi:hypothetical protein
MTLTQHLHKDRGLVELIAASVVRKIEAELEDAHMCNVEHPSATCGLPEVPATNSSAPQRYRPMPSKTMPKRPTNPDRITAVDLNAADSRVWLEQRHKKCPDDFKDGVNGAPIDRGSKCADWN